MQRLTAQDTGRSRGWQPHRLVGAATTSRLGGHTRWQPHGVQRGRERQRAGRACGIACNAPRRRRPLVRRPGHSCHAQLPWSVAVLHAHVGASAHLGVQGSPREAVNARSFLIRDGVQSVAAGMPLLDPPHGLGGLRGCDASMW